jgi:hypothetical protein
MGMFRKLVRGGAAAGLLNMAMREARKPENQRRAKELFEQVRARQAKRRPSSRPT